MANKSNDEGTPLAIGAWVLIAALIVLVCPSNRPIYLLHAVGFGTIMAQGTIAAGRPRLK